MSENNAPPAISDETKKNRQFRHMFKGRFSDRHANAILEHHQYNVGNAVNFVLESNAEDVSKLIKTLDKDAVQQIQNDAEQTCKDITNRKQTRVRQFACATCDNVWWRKVPRRKMVSRCHGCKQKYDPVPRDKEFGWAMYHCQNCGKEFSGFGQMGVESPCYRCRAMVIPKEIKPPSKRGPRKSRNTHTCVGDNCFNKTPGRRHAFYGTDEVTDDSDEVPKCVHPKSTQKRVMDPSLSIPHQSTGSTISTFLTQDDLDRERDLEVDIMPSIPENSDSYDNSD